MFANNTMQVNSVQVPESDIMATNGVIHFVNQVLYPADLPVGSQELHMLLRRLISYIQIKYISGFRYQEIPLTFLKRIIQIVEEVPDVTKVTRVIESKPTLTKVTRVIESKPTITKVTRVIEGAPAITKVTRVVSGPQYSVSTGNLDIEGADVSISHVEGTSNFDPESLTKMIQGNSRRTSPRRVLAGNRRRGRD
ncbi:Periostin [Larimichthys crocea]|nr:Periostin [Larimichthys crocea]